MLKFIEVGVNFFLITIILLRVPQENVGLASFANKNKFLGSPSSAQRFLNFLTVVGILIYFGLALKFNLVQN